MADSRPSTLDEKAPVKNDEKASERPTSTGLSSIETPPPRDRKSFFRRSKLVDDENSIKAPTEVKPPETPAVSFWAMFRCVQNDSIRQQSADELSSFSTKFELFIDFIGLIAAVGAGAAQV